MELPFPKNMNQNDLIWRWLFGKMTQNTDVVQLRYGFYPAIRLKTNNLVRIIEDRYDADAGLGESKENIISTGIPC